MPQDKPMAVYGPKAMKAEGDEQRSLELMKKAEEERKAREEAERKKATKKAAPKPGDFKPSTETEKLTKKLAKGGSTASKRADGCAMKGKTRGKMV